MNKIYLLLAFIIVCSCSKDDESNPKEDVFIGDSGTFIDDRDGQVYNWVRIGEQIWMAENLKATKLNDGTPVLNLTDPTEWGESHSTRTPAFCWYYNNEAAYKNVYGALYNFHAVATNKLSPKGWHVPNEKDWNQLEIYLGMDPAVVDQLGARGTDEGAKLKETGLTHWKSPNTGATNETGFTALPGGQRIYNEFIYLGNYGRWWSEPYDSFESYGRTTYYWGAEMERKIHYNSEGLSVRCIKD